MERLEFEIKDVPMESVSALEASLYGGGPALLKGSVGSGRSHAALAATRRAIYLNFGQQHDRGIVALAQAANQLHQPVILQAYMREGMKSALNRLLEVSDGRALIADDADALVATAERRPDDDDVPGMLHESDELWWSCLTERRDPTVLVVAHAPRDTGLIVVQHVPPSGWPVMLRFAEGGWRNWPRLGGRLGGSPDALFLARQVAPMMSAEELNALVDDESSDLLTELGRIFRSRGGGRVTALDLVSALEGAPEGLVRRAMVSLRPRKLEDPLEDLEELDRLFEGLLRHRLISIRGGVVCVSPAARRSGAVQPLSAPRALRTARLLLETVNDLSSLQPQDVSTVLAAHRLAVSAGDLDLALQTARHHGIGLIDLARQRSQGEDLDAAWQLYDAALSLLDRPPANTDPATRRIRSYALNYRAWNGRRSDRMSDVDALNDVLRATDLWPENARWQGHRIELLVRLGHTQDALRALAEAEVHVSDHPQRARHLRVYPALVCIRGGRPRLGVEFLGLDRRPTAWETDEIAVDLVKGMLDRLKRGVEVRELASPRWRLVFHRPLSLSLELVRAERPWTAQIAALHAVCVETSATRALDRLLDTLADELRACIGAPTAWLSDVDADRKAMLIAAIDVLESDFGLEDPRERWLVGRLEQGTLVILDERLGDRVPVLSSALPAVERPGLGLWFGRVPVDRSGRPEGPVQELQPAGAGRSLEDIRRYYRERFGDLT